MPWKVRAGGKDCPFEVIKSDTGKRVACHPTRERALAQMRALYAHEPAVKSGNPYHDEQGRFSTGSGGGGGGSLVWTKPHSGGYDAEGERFRYVVRKEGRNQWRLSVHDPLTFQTYHHYDSSDPRPIAERHERSSPEEQRQLRENFRPSLAAGKATPMDVVTKSVEATLEPVDDEESPTGRFHAILSTEDLDRDGEELDADDWLLPLPERINIDTDHGRSVEKTVGSAVPTLKDRQLHVDGGFSSVPHAQLARTLVKEGHIDKMSVTYRVVKDAGGVPKRELLSGAFVALPANPNAVVLSAKSAKAIDDKQLDASGNNPDGKSHAQTMHDVAVGLGAQCANRTEADTGEDEGANKDIKDWTGKTVRTIKTSSTETAGSLQESAEESAAADTTTPPGVAVSAAADESADDVAKQAALLHARSLAFLIQKNCQ